MTSFKEMKTKHDANIQDVTLVIDADSLVYRASFAQEKQGVLMGSKQDAVDMVDQLLADIMARCNSNKYELHLTGGGNFRYDVAVTHPYKGNRKQLEKPRLYKDVLKYMVKKLGAVIHEGLEADDFMRIRFNQLGKEKCVIVAVDKDIWQIPAIIYNYAKGEFSNVSEIEGFKQLYTQMLTGDTSDNIKGVFGIGKVKAEKLLADCETEEQMYNIVQAEYSKAFGVDKYEDRFIENLSLLYLRDAESKTALDSLHERMVAW